MLLLAPDCHCGEPQRSSLSGTGSPSGSESPAATEVLLPSAAAIAEVFPPRWQLGQRWRVAMKPYDGDLDAGDPDDPLFPGGTSELEFSVVALPKQDDDVYRIEAMDPAAPDWRYDLEIRAQGGSLSRVVERRHPGKSERIVLENGDLPTTVTRKEGLGRLLVPFPAVPAVVPLVGPVRYLNASGINTIEQRFRREGDLLHIALDEVGSVDVLAVRMEWRKGDLWWSTIRCFGYWLPEFRRAHPEVTQLCSGRLLRVGAPDEPSVPGSSLPPKREVLR